MAHQEPVIPFWTALATYFCYTLLVIIGRIKDRWTKIFEKRVDHQGFAPLTNDWEDFFTRHLYKRVHDCWNRPITSCPGTWIDVQERQIGLSYTEPLKYTGKETHCLNLGSYNYLGFGDPNSTTKPDVFQALAHFGVSTCSARTFLGSTTLHREAEALVARFIGKEDSIIVGMGFGTNSSSIPALIGKGGLIISDAINHASIVNGARTSGAVINVFKHNDTEDLERVVRSAIINGQPRTHRPWTKILIIVEGIYSMEGEFCPLPEIVRIKKKYGCYLYLDEAHSIGAVGPAGKGVCDKFKVDPADVDVMMGTFTKSFGSVGGYIAGSKDLIRYLRRTSAGSCYSASISPPAVQQIISAIKIMLGEDGTNIGQNKLRALRDNSNYFRQRLMNMGVHTLGDWDSPIIPIMVYHPAKLAGFSREALKRNMAVVVVGYPATPLLLSRARICISAGHTHKDLEEACDKLDDITDLMALQYNPRLAPVPAPFSAGRAVDKKLLP